MTRACLTFYKNFPRRFLKCFHRISYFYPHSICRSQLSFIMQKLPLSRETQLYGNGKEKVKKNAQAEGRSRKPGNLRSQTRIPRETFNPVSVLSRKILCISLMSLCERFLLRGNGIRLIHSLNVLELIRIKKTRSLLDGERYINVWLLLNASLSGLNTLTM